MGSIFDYIEWRGDLTLAADPINDVDISILCRLSYIPFGCAVSTEPVPLERVARAVLEYARDDVRKFRKKEDQRLLQVLMDSPRFCNMDLCDFVDIYNEDLSEQFSAITMLLDDGTVAIIFRGTDGTLVGWKEDFNMCFSSEIPAQKDAVAYLERAAKRFPTQRLRLAGHSKGGNLAMYAAAYCSDEIHRRIMAVRSLDGPGFNEVQAAAGRFSRIADVALTYLPDASIIGMLLEQMGESVIIDSQSMGLFQHNTYLWEIRRKDFVRGNGLTDTSNIIDRTLKDWLNSLTPDQRERMVDGFFQILQSSSGKTLRELWYGRNALTLLSTVVRLDTETRNHLYICLKLLRKALKDNLAAERMIENMLDAQ